MPDAYWRYEVCIGAEARQWHEAFGVRKVEHHLGSYQAETTGRQLVQRFTRGHQGRFATLSLTCPPVTFSASHEQLVVREPQPHHYVMTLHHAAVCGEASAEPFESLWGECFATSVLSADEWWQGHQAQPLPIRRAEAEPPRPSPLPRSSPSPLPPEEVPLPQSLQEARSLLRVGADCSEAVLRAALRRESIGEDAAEVVLRSARRLSEGDPPSPHLQDGESRTVRAGGNARARAGRDDDEGGGEGGVQGVPRALRLRQAYELLLAHAHARRATAAATAATIRWQQCIVLTSHEEAAVIVLSAFSMICSSFSLPLSPARTARQVALAAYTSSGCTRVDY